jgi:hypothetical protein
MGNVPKWLRLLALAYGDITTTEEIWLKHHKPYSRWVIIGRRLFNMAIYTVITVFVIAMAVRLGWVVIVIPVG